MVATEINLKELVFAYDLETVGVRMELPKEFEAMEFPKELFDKHLQPTEARSSVVAYSALFCEYMVANPSGNDAGFRDTIDKQKFMSLCEELDQKLNRNLSYEDLMAFKKTRFLNLTRVNLKTQVR